MKISLFSMSLSMFSCLAMAQVPYEKIEVGSVLQKDGISVGSFVKPFPLPDGEWLVVNKRADDIVLRNGRGETVASTPRVFLTMKNKNTSASPLFAMVMSFTPEASSVNWGNGNCESKNPKIFVDDFGTRSDSLIYACSYIHTHTRLKEKIAKVQDGTNKWWKNNLASLAEFADEIPDNAFLIDVMGNQYRGRNISFTFIIRRDGDPFSDSGYAAHIKDWTHATGLSLQKVVDNSATTFALPTAYVAQAAQ